MKDSSKKSHSSFGIKGDSLNLQSLDGVSGRHFDVIIITSSWDDRCLSLTQATDLTSEQCISIIFDDKDDSGRRDRNDLLISRYARKISKSNVISVSGISTSIDDVLSKVYKALFETRIKLGRPLSILFDLTTVPRYYPLSIMTMGFSQSIVRKIDFFYTEGIYPEHNPVKHWDDEVLFTTGKWTTIPIPFLRGLSIPTAPKRYFVSIGFEGSKTLLVLNKTEPDIVNIVVPDPGFSPDYEKRSISANSQLIETFGIDLESDAIRHHAADAISVWRSLEQKNQSSPLINDLYLCSGSKPHSLGMALASFCLQRPATIYCLPERHNPISVEPLESYWTYSLENMLTPHS